MRRPVLAARDHDDGQRTLRTLAAHFGPALLARLPKFGGGGSMSGKSLALGIGAFLLFLILYSIIGAAVGVLGTTLIDNVIVRKVLDYVTGSVTTYEIFLDFLNAFLAGFFGVLLAMLALNKIMKNCPIKAVGAAFIVWLLSNYALHFIFFPDRTDDTVRHGLVQSIVACVMAWIVFELPPLTSKKPQI
jgi:hypothetical protein